MDTEVLGDSKITGESCSAPTLTPRRPRCLQSCHRTTDVMSRGALMAGGSLRADNL